MCILSLSKQTKAILFGILSILRMCILSFLFHTPVPNKIACVRCEIHVGDSQVLWLCYFREEFFFFSSTNCATSIQTRTHRHDHTWYSHTWRSTSEASSSGGGGTKATTMSVAIYGCTNTRTHTHKYKHTRTHTHTHTTYTHTHMHAHANARYETQKQAKGNQHKIHCHRLNLRKKQTLKFNAHANARNFALSHPLALSLTLVLSHTHHIILHASPTVSIFVRWRLMTPLSKSEKRLLIVLAKSMLQVWSVSNRVREHEFVYVTQRVLWCTVSHIYERVCGSAKQGH